MRFRPSAILLPSFLVSSFITSAVAGTSRDQLYALSLEDLLKVEVESVSMFKEDALKVAASVYSVDMDDANRWNYFDNSDALDMASGVQTYHTFFGGNPIAIRGYAQFLSVRGVSTLIDGVPVNDLIFGSGQYDNEHISLGITDTLEVIKGPGSTLYGSDAFHGTMAFKSYYREVEDFSADMYFSGDEQRRTKVALSREVMPGQFINLAVDHRLQDNSQWQYYNQVIAANDHRDPELENNSYTIKLHNKESEDLYYKLSVVGNDYSGSGFVGGGASFGYANNDLSASDHNMLLTQGAVARQLTPNYRLGLDVSHVDAERQNEFEVGGGIFQQGMELGRLKSQLYLQAEYDTGNRFYAALERSEIDSKEEVAHPITVGPGYVSTYRKYDRSVNTAFIQGRWMSGWHDLEIELGARYDDYSDFGAQVTPRIGFILSFDNGDVAKLLYGNAFRAPITLEQSGSLIVQGDPKIKPEVIDSVEAIYIKVAENWQLELAAYRSEWSDGIVALPKSGLPAPYTSAFVNSGENEAYGLEVNFRFQRDKYSLEWNTGYAKSKSTLTDQDFSAFPELTSNLQLNYQLSDKLSLSGKVIYRSDWSKTTSPDDESLSDYLRVDSSLSYQWSPELVVRMVVKNLFDRDNYVPSLLDASTGERDPIEQQVSFGVSVQL